jgi:hypothetical protein
MSAWGLEMLWLVAAAFGLASSVIYLVNAPSREAIDLVLESPLKSRFEVGMFTVCKRGDAEDWSAYSLVPPERVWCYGPEYLGAFRDRASAAKTSFGDTALQRYLHPVLMWNDIAFAILTGLFAALADIGIALAVSKPSVQLIFFCLAAVGLVYGIADVFEDLTLINILKVPSLVDANQAARANLLTRIKVLAMTASLSGGTLFIFLMAIRSIYRRFSSLEKA